MSTTKKHILILCLVILFPLGIVAGINISMDPFGVFEVSRITGFNHFLSDSFYRSSGNELKKNRIKSHIQQATGPALVIGSSKILWGIDTCNLDGVDRAGLYGLTFNDSTEFLKTAIESGNYNEIFVEILSNRKKSDTIDQFPSLLNPNLYIGLSTFKVSMANLMDSRKYTTLEKSNCYSYASNSQAGVVAQRNDLDQQNINLALINFDLNSDDIVNSFKSISSVCDANMSDNISIVYFYPPIHPNGPNAERFKGLKEENKNILNKIFPTQIGKCIFRYADIDSTLDSSDLADESNWFDYGHFKPSLGNKALYELMRFSK